MSEVNAAYEAPGDTAKRRKDDEELRKQGKDDAATEFDNDTSDFEAKEILPWWGVGTKLQATGYSLLQLISTMLRRTPRYVCAGAGVNAGHSDIRLCTYVHGRESIRHALALIEYSNYGAAFANALAFCLPLLALVRHVNKHPPTPAIYRG